MYRLIITGICCTLMFPFTVSSAFAGGFSKNCGDIRLNEQFVLSALCILSNPYGASGPTWINLADKIEIQSGYVLAWGSGGLNTKTCYYTLNGTVLTAHCMLGGGFLAKIAESTLNLDERISNVNGVLTLD